MKAGEFQVLIASTGKFIAALYFNFFGFTRSVIQRVAAYSKLDAG